MPRNYDTSSGLPYQRVTRIVIDYLESGLPKVEYFEVEAILDSSGQVHHLAGGQASNLLNMAAVTEPVQCVDPRTGADIPGMTVTRQQLMLGLLAFLRFDQKLRDSQS